MTSPANIQIGPAMLALDEPIEPDDRPWHSRAYRGRMTRDHCRILDAAGRKMPPEVLAMHVYGEPQWPVMVSTIQTLMSPPDRMVLVEIKLVRRVAPARPWVGA